MKNSFRNIIVFFTFLLVHSFEAQVVLHGLEGVGKKVDIPEVKFKALKKSTDNLRIELVRSGYLAASIDSLVKVDSLLKADVYFYLGERFSFAEITADQEVYEVLDEIGKSNLLEQRKKLSPAALARVIDYSLGYFEDHGYPFAEIQLDSAQWIENSLKGKLVVSKGSLIKMKSIKVVGSCEVSDKIISQMIGIDEGDYFSQSKIEKVNALLKTYAYIRVVRDAEFEFVNQDCNLYLYLDDQNANFFNAILGVLPDNATGKINITGDAKIKLMNALNSGELIALNWRKLLPLTQNLEVDLNYPFLLNSPVGVDVQFDLYKKDTSYLDVLFRVGGQIRLSSRLVVGAYYKNKSSSLLSTEKYQYVTELPDFADVHTNEYGLSLAWNNLDFLYNPSFGWEVGTEGTIGDKRIKQNIALNPELYNDLDLRTTQVYLKGQVNRFIKLYKKNVLKIGASGGWVVNENIFLNELFRLGGLRTIRGFDEESIFASGYGIGTLEYRFLFEEFSNLFVFGEMMYYDQRVRQDYFHDLPKSFGLGINFQTKPGIFSLSYSLGSQRNNPFLLRSAKIHFGFVNYF